MSWWTTTLSNTSAYVVTRPTSANTATSTSQMTSTDFKASTTHRHTPIKTLSAEPTNTKNKRLVTYRTKYSKTPITMPMMIVMPKHNSVYSRGKIKVKAD